MKNIHTKLVTASTILFILVFSTCSLAEQTTDDPKSENSSINGIPSKTPKISLRADTIPLDDVLKDICNKSRWGLVIDAPEKKLAQKITVLLPQKKPAEDVLKMVLAQKGLTATFADDILYIADIPTPADIEISLGSPSMPPTPAADTDSAADSRDIVIKDFSTLKKMQKRLKEKFQHHREHGDNSNVERVEIGHPVKIAADEIVNKAVSVGDNVTIEGRVDSKAVAVGGSTVIKKGAHVGTDAVAIGGNVHVESGAIVEGEAVAVGGKVIVDEGGIVRGDRVSVNVPFPAISGVAGILGMGAMFWFLAALLRSFVILAVALMIVWVAPQRVTVAKDYLQKKTGWSIFSGFLILLAFVPIVVLLTMTIIGIPLIPFLILFLIAIIVFGLAALLSWLGYWIPIFKNKKSPVGAVIIGFFVFLIINVIPVIGGIFLLFASLAAAGATFLSRFGKKTRAL